MQINPEQVRMIESTDGPECKMDYINGFYQQDKVDDFKLNVCQSPNWVKATLNAIDKSWWKEKR